MRHSRRFGQLRIIIYMARVFKLGSARSRLVNREVSKNYNIQSEFTGLNQANASYYEWILGKAARSSRITQFMYIFSKTKFTTIAWICSFFQTWKETDCCVNQTTNKHLQASSIFFLKRLQAKVHHILELPQVAFGLQLSFGHFILMKTHKGKTIQLIPSIWAE